MNAVQNLIQAHITRYPEAEIPDVYKLLHQATFGATHAVEDPESTREWLDTEWHRYEPLQDALLVESVSPVGEGDWVRLHLRPYRAANGDFEQLLAVILEAGRGKGGSEATLAQRWGDFEAMVSADRNLQKRFDLAEVRLFGTAHAERNYPNEHHTPTYYRTYQPVYRVLKLSDARVLCGAQGIPFTVDG